MSIEVKVPQLPESVTDATLVTWHKRAGDHVRRDENLVDLETDKVVLEVPAPNDGVLTEIKIEDGATVTMGQVLAVLEPGQVPAESASQTSEKPVPRPLEEAAHRSRRHVLGGRPHALISPLVSDPGEERYEHVLKHPDNAQLKATGP